MLKQFLGVIFLLSLSYSALAETTTTIETKQYNGLFWHAKVSETSSIDNKAQPKMTMMIEFINRKNKHSLAKFMNATTSGDVAKGEEHVSGYVKNKDGVDVKSLLSYTFIPQLKDDGTIELHYLIATLSDDKNTEVNDILVQGEMLVNSHKNYTIHLNDFIDVNFSIN